MGLPQFDFLVQFIKYPRVIGSITPSSSFLARAMVAPVPWHDAEVVVELGAGTGVFTKYIRGKIKTDSRAYIFEKNALFRKQLARQYPEFAHHADAVQLSSTLHKAGERHADAIISGLPFTVFPKPLTLHIMDEVTRSLKPGGLFITFQFSLHMKKQLQAHFSNVNIQFVPLNILPAFVFICYK